MTSERYRRLHAACLAMARQSDLPDIQARWLKLAEAWFNVATGVDDTKPLSQHSVTLAGAQPVLRRTGPPAKHSKNFLADRGIYPQIDNIRIEAARKMK